MRVFEYFLWYSKKIYSNFFFLLLRTYRVTFIDVFQVGRPIRDGGRPPQFISIQRFHLTVERITRTDQKTWVLNRGMLNDICKYATY